MSKFEIIKTLLRCGRQDLATAVAMPKRKAVREGASLAELAAMEPPKYTAEEVTSASLARLWQHFMTNKPDRGVLIVSADRNDRALYQDDDGKVRIDPTRNEKLNAAARKRLEPLLRKLGGYIKTMGGYQEEGQWVNEMSYVVPDVSEQEARDFAREVGKKAALNKKPLPDKLKAGDAVLAGEFRQESVLWANNVVGAFLFYHDGSTDSLGKQMKANDVRNYFTEWKRRRRPRKEEREAALRAIKKAKTPYEIAPDAERAVDDELYRRSRFGFGSVAVAFRLRYIPDSPSDWRTWNKFLYDHTHE